MATTYRTRTYIAADWSTDKDAVDQLRKWNDSKYWSLSFTDAHDLTSSSDTSLNCSIKASLKSRMDASKTFVLIVGSNTKTVRSGSCAYCSSYQNYRCTRGHSTDFRSYIEYECAKAVEAGIKIIVLYKYTKVRKDLCPDAVKNVGTHTNMIYYENGTYYWDYEAVKKAFDA